MEAAAVAGVEMAYVVLYRATVSNGKDGNGVALHTRLVAGEWVEDMSTARHTEVKKQKNLAVVLQWVVVVVVAGQE